MFDVMRDGPTDMNRFMYIKFLNAGGNIITNYVNYHILR